MFGNETEIQCSKLNLLSVPKLIPSQATILNLSFNRISKLEDGDFRGCFNLVELDLSNNAVANVQPGIFASLGNLKVLKIREMF